MALGRKWFGKIAVQLFGRDDWEKQDAAKVWSDGGAIKEVVEEAARQLEKIVAENAILAVSDFSSTGVAALRADENGEVVIGIRMESGQAHQIIEIPLRALFMAALMDARQKLGTDTQAQDAVSSLLTICQQIVQALRMPPPGLHAGQAQNESPTPRHPAGRPPGRITNPIAPQKQEGHPVFPGPVMG